MASPATLDWLIPDEMPLLRGSIILSEEFFLPECEGSGIPVTPGTTLTGCDEFKLMEMGPTTPSLAREGMDPDVINEAGSVWKAFSLSRMKEVGLPVEPK